MKKFIKIAVALVAVGALLLIPQNVGFAALITDSVTVEGNRYQIGEEIPELRGRAHKVTYAGGNSYTAEFVGSPEFTQSIVDGSWVEYGFGDYGDFYSVQHPWNSVAFYDYHTVVYDETFTEVVVYNDRWVVEYWAGNKWSDTGFWGIVRSYEIVEDGIKLKRTGSTTIGQREEIYYFRNGSPCKIEIRQDTDDVQTIRFVWKPSGIVASSERNIVTGEFDEHAGEVAGLNYYDEAGSFIYTLRWYDELGITEAIIPVAESHAQGRKATVTFGNFASSAGSTVILDPDTFYPDADPENTSVDGEVGHTDSDGLTWASLRSAAGNRSSDASDWDYAFRFVCHADGGNKFTNIYRGVHLFDTSALPDVSSITAATLSLYGYLHGTSGGITAWAPDVNVYSSAPASNTVLEVGDFNSLGSVAYSTAIASGEITLEVYNDFILNSSGRNHISKTGVSKFGTRNANYDVSGSIPGSAPLVTVYFAVRTAEAGAGYKPKLVVTYIEAPTVTTQAVTNVEATTATGNGNITATGGVNCDYRGVAWDTTSRGDPGSSSPAASAYANYNSEGPGSYGTGAFTRSMTSLDTGTTHYARAYAHNSVGWNWGSEVSFLTKPAAPTSVSATDGSDTSKVVITWVKSTGANDYQVYRDGGGLGWLGDVATYDDTGADAPTITPGTTVASDGTETAHIALSLSGTSTNNGTTHTYKVRARNASGESADSSTNTGYRGVGGLTYQWQKSAGDSDASYSPIDGATSSTYNDTAASAGTISNAGTVTASDGTQTAYVTLSLAGEATTDGEGRYYKCDLTATGASPQTSASNRGYRGVGSITYQWQRSAADSDASYSNIGGATTDPYNDTAAPAGIITPGTADASDGGSTAHVTLSLAGESVADGAGRYYQCIVSSVDASNSPQTSDNNRGYRTTGSITYQWQRSAADSDANYGNISGGTTDPYDDVGAPAPTITHGTCTASDGTETAHIILTNAGASANEGAGRYFRCVLSATGTSNQNSTTDRGYRTVGSLTRQWYRSAADSDADYSVLSGATSTPHNDTTAPAPTITPGSTIATDGDYTDKVALSLSGISTNTFGRHYKCYHTATGASSGYTSNDRGYKGVGALTYQWQRSAGASDSDYSNIDGATSSTYDDSAAPAGSISNSGSVTSSDDNAAHVTLSLASEATTAGEDRYYKCVLNATGATEQTSASNDGNRSVGAITYQWQRSAADSDASYGNIGGATTDPYNDTAAPAGSITPGAASAGDGITEAYVALLVTGHSTTEGVGRYYRCIISSVGASNSPQTSNTDRGHRIVGTITFQWQRSDADADEAYNSDIGTTNPYNDMGAPSDGSGRWYRCLLDASGAAQAETTHNRGYKAVAIYEHLSEGGDADGDDIYGNNWADQQFTVGDVSHTITSARIYAKRVGTPGTVTLSLRYADGNDEPTGTDLLYATLDGDAFSVNTTWYEFSLGEMTLESGRSYALVLRAPSGDDSSYIEWRWDSGGGLDNAIAGLSTDGGVTWTVDAGGADYLFEIRGASIITLLGARVFSGYLEEGDWLITLTYENHYVPYYPNEDPKVYFYLQLLDGSVVEAQVSCAMWKYRPGSIYIAESIADTLEWGATDYVLRLQGDFGNNPYSDYYLTASDWSGTDLMFLDSWVIAQANSIGSEEDTTLTVHVADVGEVLNATGHTIFSIGIPELNVVRPELFEMVLRQPDYEETTWSPVLPGEADWEVRLGPQISGALTSIGDLFGVDGKGVGGFLCFVAFMIVFCLLTLFGNVIVGLCLGYPILLTGAWFGVVDWILLGVMTFAVAVVFVYKVFLVR